MFEHWLEKMELGVSFPNKKKEFEPPAKSNESMPELKIFLFQNRIFIKRTRSDYYSRPIDRVKCGPASSMREK